MPPARDGAADVRLVSKVLVDDVVLAAHQNTTGAIAATRHGYQVICLVLQGLTVLAHYMVEA